MQHAYYLLIRYFRVALAALDRERKAKPINLALNSPIFKTFKKPLGRLLSSCTKIDKMRQQRRWENPRYKSALLKQKLNSSILLA
jgi:hypothetical protein